MLPSGMFFQLVEDGEVAIFKDQMKFLLPAEDFDQVDEIRVLQLLQSVSNTKQNIIKLVDIKVVDCRLSITRGRRANTLSMRISLRAIFLISGSSSDSTNFLMATI